jgi:hypothetical protein
VDDADAGEEGKQKGERKGQMGDLGPSRMVQAFPIIV